MMRFPRSQKWEGNSSMDKTAGIGKALDRVVSGGVLSSTISRLSSGNAKRGDGGSIPGDRRAKEVSL